MNTKILMIIKISSEKWRKQKIETENSQHPVLIKIYQVIQCKSRSCSQGSLELGFRIQNEGHNAS